RRDLVFDAGRNLLYITTSSGVVQRWDVASQQLLSAWNVGAFLNGADITPDGNWLYVTESVPITGHLGVLHKVNLATGAVTDATSDTFPHTFNSPQWASGSSIAVNRSDNLIAVNASGASIRVYDASFNVMHDFTSLTGGICFDPTRDVMYVADALSDKLYAYD